MVGVYHLNIIESKAELKNLLRKEKIGSGKERIQLLYLLKTQKAKSITQASELGGATKIGGIRRLAKVLNP